MKRTLVIGGGALGVVVAVVVVAVVFLFSSLDSLIKEAVEKYGSEIIQAEVRLNKVEIDVTSGQGGLSGLKIGNPKGFETPSAFELGGISVKLDIGSVTEDVIVIKEIVISKPQVTYELGTGGSNIDAIRNNIDRYVKAHGGGKSEAWSDAKTGAKTDAKTDEGGGPKLVIENLYIRGGTVNVSANIPLMRGRKMTAPLPDIHLKDIGKEEKGATPGEVAEEILASVGKSVSDAMSGIGVGSTLESLRTGLAGATKSVTDAVSGAGEAVKGAVSGAGEAVKGVVSGAGDAVKGVTEDVGSKIKKLFGD